MPPHVVRHRRGPSGRRFRRGGFAPVFVDVYDGICDDDRVCPLDTPATLDDAMGAGDILPTFVTPNDARAYIDQTNAGYESLNGSVTASQVPDAFKSQWGQQLANWRAFASSAKASVGWLNTTAVMQQTDRWAQDLKNWDAQFQAAGGKDIGPPPLSPGQGTPNPSSGNVFHDVTWLLVAGGVLAAIIVLGPHFKEH